MNRKQKEPVRSGWDELTPRCHPNYRISPVTLPSVRGRPPTPRRTLRKRKPTGTPVAYTNRNLSFPTHRTFSFFTASLL